MANEQKRQYAGKITISRYSNGVIAIRVIDGLSGTEFVEVNMTPHDFGEAVTGLGHVPCTFELHPALVGMKAENKTEIVPYADKQHRKHDPKALAALEVDGWEVRESDLTNHHCWSENGIKCVFFRYVAAE